MNKIPIQFCVPFLELTAVGLETSCVTHNTLHQLCDGDTGENAVAVMDVNIRDLYNVFQYRTSNKVNVSEIARDENIEYYVFASNWKKQSDREAYLTNDVSRNQMGNLYPLEETTISYNYLRYLASALFNTPYGYKALANTQELLDEVRAKCNIDCLIRPILERVDSDKGTHPGLSSGKNNDHGKKHTTRRFLTCREHSNENVSYHLMKQIASDNPERFDDIPDKLTYQNVPLQPDDSIIAKVTIHANSHQNEFAMRYNNANVPPKTYVIKIVLR